MQHYKDLISVLNKGKKIQEPSCANEKILKTIYTFSQKQNINNNHIKNFNDPRKNKHIRGLYFISLYYGLINESLTLDAIGNLEEKVLTRERVRQIINQSLNQLKNTKTNLISFNENPFHSTHNKFLSILNGDKFMQFEDLVRDNYFHKFKNNIKGLISFLNDCNIKQISYRKNYYFYPDFLDKDEIIISIQENNKKARRKNTLNNMSQKYKTVTYVPAEVREHLVSFSNDNKINLNPLYEQILSDYIVYKEYISDDFEFQKTKSWRARKGTANWKQIGIYIDKDVFYTIKEEVDRIKNQLEKDVSLMNFISQSLVWHYNQNNLNS